jgi:hypothetical protein
MIDGRNTLITIVQGSTIEVFRGFDIAVAPIRASQGLPVDLDQKLSAASTFASPEMSGSLAIFVPFGTHTIARHPEHRHFDAQDWTRELCNQVMGRVKNRMHSCDIDLRTGLPTSVVGNLLDRHRQGMSPNLIFGFRSLRGDVTVTLSGEIDYSRIHYTGKVVVAKEGDVILFDRN